MTSLLLSRTKHSGHFIFLFLISEFYYDILYSEVFVWTTIICSAYKYISIKCIGWVCACAFYIGTPLNFREKREEKRTHIAIRIVFVCVMCSICACCMHIVATHAAYLYVFHRAMPCIGCSSSFIFFRMEFLSRWNEQQRRHYINYNIFPVCVPCSKTSVFWHFLAFVECFVYLCASERCVQYGWKL